VRLGICGMWDEVVCCGRCYSRLPHDFCQRSYLLVGSLADNYIDAAGARDLGAALQVNTTLTKLM
jgi:hypothetical protein